MTLQMLLNNEEITKYQLSKISGVPKTTIIDIEEDSGSVLCSGATDSTALYFSPRISFCVPAEELSEDSYFSVGVLPTGRGLEIDVYDVEDFKPAVAVRYETIASNQTISTDAVNLRATPVMFNESSLKYDEKEGVTVLSFTVAQSAGVKEYYSENLNLLDGYEKGDILYLYGRNNKVTKVEPVMYNGKHLGPDNLPDISKREQLDSGTNAGMFVIKNHSHAYAFEVYELLSSTEMVLQQGEQNFDETREFQRVAFTRNVEWMFGGVLLYENNGRTGTVSAGTLDKCRTVKKDGSDKATIVIALMAQGNGRQYLMYNLEN